MRRGTSRRPSVNQVWVIKLEEEGGIGSAGVAKMTRQESGSPIRRGSIRMEWGGEGEKGTEHRARESRER